MKEQVFFGMKNNYLEWNCVIWNEIEIVRIKINKKECSRSVPMRNVPLHREENWLDGIAGRLVKYYTITVL